DLYVCSAHAVRPCRRRGGEQHEARQDAAHSVASLDGARWCNAVSGVRRCSLAVDRDAVMACGLLEKTGDRGAFARDQIRERKLAAHVFVIGRRRVTSLEDAYQVPTMLGLDWIAPRADRGAKRGIGEGIAVIARQLVARRAHVARERKRLTERRRCG